MKISELLNEEDQDKSKITRRSFIGALAAGAAGAASAGTYKPTWHYATNDPERWAREQRVPFKKEDVKVWNDRLKDLETRGQRLYKTLVGLDPNNRSYINKTEFMVGDTPAIANATNRGNESTIRIDLSICWDLSDDALAYIIAHEIGHVALDHITSYKHLTPKQSHAQEHAADIYGVKLANRGGYDPKKAFTSFERKQRTASLTHPDYETRVNKIRQSTGIQVSQYLNKLMQHINRGLPYVDVDSDNRAFASLPDTVKTALGNIDSNETTRRA